MPPEMPKVTVLVAVRNAEKFLRGCLDSLLAQTIIDDAKIMVIDGNSTQNEKGIVRQYQKKYPFIKYIFTKKPGIGHAWNLGIRASEGKYVTTLNADDRLRKDALEIMAKALDDNPDIALVYGDSYVTFTANETFDNNSGGGRLLNWPEYSHKELLIQCICGPHPMWRRHLHDKIGYFYNSYRIAFDYEFWLRIAEKYKILRIPGVMGLYYANRLCNSQYNPKLTHEENLRIKHKYLNPK